MKKHALEIKVTNFISKFTSNRIEMKAICPRGNNKVDAIIKLLFIFPYITINVYYSC